MANVNAGASVWVTTMRVAQLDSSGYPDSGANMLVTNTLVKLTDTPVVETGDDIAIKGASGDLGVFAKHADMPKYHTMSMELYAPDPLLEQMGVGGTVLASAASAPGTPTGA